MTTIVADNNQVSIPPEIARDLDIRPGTQLDWAATGEGTIVVKLLPSRGELARQLMGAGRRWIKAGSDPIGDLILERQEEDKLDQADERR